MDDLPITFRWRCCVRYGQKRLNRFKEFKVVERQYDTLQSSETCLYNSRAKTNILIDIRMSCTRYFCDDIEDYDKIIDNQWRFHKHDWFCCLSLLLNDFSRKINFLRFSPCVLNFYSPPSCSFLSSSFDIDLYSFTYTQQNCLGLMNFLENRINGKFN